MIYICLDTNVYINCALLTKIEHDPEPQNDLLKSLLDILGEGNVKLLLPEVVKAEYKGQIKKRAGEIKQGLGRLESLLKTKKDNKFHDLMERDKQQIIEKIQELIDLRRHYKEKAEEYIDQLFSHQNTVEIKLTHELLTKAYLRQISNLKPFNDSKLSKNKPFPIDTDCVIVESIYEEVNGLGDEIVLHLCTEDIDYYTDENRVKLHPDIKDCFPVKTFVYNNLPELLANFNKPQTEEVIKGYGEVQRMFSDNVLSAAMTAYKNTQMVLSSGVLDNARNDIDYLFRSGLAEQVMSAADKMNAIDLEFMQKVIPNYMIALEAVRNIIND